MDSASYRPRGRLVTRIRVFTSCSFKQLVIVLILGVTPRRLRDPCSHILPGALPPPRVGFNSLETV